MSEVTPALPSTVRDVWHFFKKCSERENDYCPHGAIDPYNNPGGIE